MKRTLKVIFLVMFAWLALTIFSQVNAASATIKASKTSATVGDTVKVTVTVNAATWNLKVSGSAEGSIVGFNSDAENEKTTKTYSVKPSKAGTYKVSLSGDVTDGETDKNTTINNSVSITFNEKTTTSKNNNTTSNNSSTTTTKTKSNNAYLSTLGVTPKEYDFSGFSKTKTSYSVTVPSDVDSLKVLYKTADSGATVKVSGNSGFEVGSDNTIKIVVTAEDGKTTKTYKIKVTKLAEEEDKAGNLIEDEDGLYLTFLELDGVDLSPEFSKDKYSYVATLDDANATEIKVDAKANKENANVEISGNTELVDGENTINILVTLDGSEEQTVYQVILTKAEKVATITNTDGATTEGAGTLNDLMGNLKKYIIIAVAVIVLIIVAVIVLIILLRRENKKIKEEISENNKNDINDLQNKTSEADNFIESLYRQRNGNLYNEEELDEEEKQTLEEINRETDEIFRDKVEGQSVKYVSEDIEEKRPRRRERGKHSK